MTTPSVQRRMAPRYRVAGERQWYPTMHGALLRHAYNLIKAKCPRTAAHEYCNTDEHDCKWHNLGGRYSRRVAERIVRMWMRAIKAGGAP